MPDSRSSLGWRAASVPARAAFTARPAAISASSWPGSTASPNAAAGTQAARHPSADRLSGIYGTILYDELAPGHQRNVTVFADGEVDRSPCGSGTSARLALLGDGPLRHDSIIGTTFHADVVEHVRAEGRDAVVTEVRGTPFRTGEHRFVLDARDPLVEGFVLR